MAARVGGADEGQAARLRRVMRVVCRASRNGNQLVGTFIHTIDDAEAYCMCRPAMPGEECSCPDYFLEVDESMSQIA
jgi:hypothetical protein